MPKAHPLFLEIAVQLRALAGNPDTTWSFYSHAEEEMVEARLDYADAYHIVSSGKITSGDTEGEFAARRFRVEGSTSDGVQAAFIVSFSNEEQWIEIVTAFRANER